MSRQSVVAMAGVVIAVLTGVASAQGWRPPAEAQRCPSKWGANDERGAANHMKPETVMRAIKLIRTGEVIELGHMLNAPSSNSPARTRICVDLAASEDKGRDRFNRGAGGDPLVGRHSRAPAVMP